MSRFTSQTAKLQTAKRHRIVALAVGAACLAATALVCAGCGASGVIDPVARAATISTGAPGYRFTLEMRMSGSSAPYVNETGSGAFDVRGRIGSLSLQMRLPNAPQITQQLGSNTLSMQTVFNETTIYMHMPAVIAEHLPADKPWLKYDLAQRMPAVGSLMSASPMSSDPSQMLQFLRGVSGSVTKVGTATVAGYRTTEYRAIIELSKEANAVPTKNRAAVRQAIQTFESLAHTKQIPIHVWIDSAHLVRRVAIQMRIALPNNQREAMNMQLTIPQYGPQPTPALPPADQVTDINDLAGAARSPGSTSNRS